MTPYNTGKVRIGAQHLKPITISCDEARAARQTEWVQRALLHKPKKLTIDDKVGIACLVLMALTTILIWRLT